jgi:3-methyladenine DNA glycosylase Mpg
MHIEPVALLKFGRGSKQTVFAKALTLKRKLGIPVDRDQSFRFVVTGDSVSS